MNKLKYHYILDYPNPVPFGDVSLRQIGIAYCEKSTTVPMHMHDNFYELTVITAGKGVVTTNDVGVAVGENDIYLSFPYEEHGIDSDCDSPLRYDFYAFVIENPQFAQAMSEFSAVRKNPLARIVHNDSIGALIRAALSETSTERMFSKKYLELLFTQILIQLIRTLAGESAVRALMPTRDEELCYQIMYYIETHIGEANVLSRLGDEFHYDYGYLTNIFSKTTKRTLSAFYRTARLERAALLIKAEKMSLTEIAYRLGYSSIFAFSKAFKKHYGITPKEYGRG